MLDIISLVFKVLSAPPTGGLVLDITEIDQSTCYILFAPLIKSEHNLFKLLQLNNKLSSFLSNIVLNTLPPYGSVAILSIINAWGRTKLVTYIEKLKTLKGFKLLYVDTDSVTFEVNDSSKIPDQGSKMGQVKVEIDNCQGFFVAPKVYYLYNDKIVKSAFKNIIINREYINTGRSKLFIDNNWVNTKPHNINMQDIIKDSILKK